MTKSKSRIELLAQRAYTGFAFSQEAGNARSLNDITFNSPSRRTQADPDI